MNLSNRRGLATDSNQSEGGVRVIPVYIPSKGRPDFATAKQLNKVERPFTVFVEPQDFKAYSDAGHVSIFKLPQNNRGIAYARQLIVEYVIGHDDSWFWMLDDDIYSFAVKVKQGDIIKDDAWRRTTHLKDGRRTVGSTSR
jgi:hypothetical protein